MGRYTITEYDDNGNVTAVTNALGNTTSYEYDALNRQTAIIDSLSETTTTTYDPEGNILSLVDPSGNATTYTYDEVYRLTEETNELGNSRNYTYDAVGNQLSATDRNNRTRRFSYDDLNRQTSEEWLDSSGNTIRTISQSYDAASQILAASDPDSAYSYAYDSDDRLISVDNQGTPGVPRVLLEYAYNSVDNLLSVTDSIDGQTAGVESFTYDALNRVTQITQSGTGVTDKRFDLAYDAASQMTNLTRYADLSGSGLVAESDYIYDELGRLRALTHSQGSTVIADYDWRYDAINRISQFNSADGSSDYSYNDRDELTGADHSDTGDESYTYDENGNRTNPGYQTGQNNQLQSDGTYDYTYDGEGNLITRTEVATGETTEYVWDYRNRLIGVTTKDSSGTVVKSVEYIYDLLNRRIGKVIDPDGPGSSPAQVERLVYDGDNIILTFDGSGKQTHRYLHGPAIDQVIADEDSSGEVRWGLADNQNTIRDVIDSTGAVLNHIVYNSFGLVTSETNPAEEFRFGYTGRELDPETGLLYYRTRYYDPGTGRFMSEDTIGFAGGDANLYRYVGNSPTNFIDPDGEEPLSSAIGLAGFLSVLDGPVPAGEIVGGVIIGGTALWLLFNGDSDQSNNPPESFLKNPPSDPTDEEEEKVPQADPPPAQQFEPITPPLHCSPESEGKRCRLEIEVPNPMTGVKQCCYTCKDWRTALICFPMREGFECPKEMDWWDPDEIPGALPLKG